MASLKTHALGSALLLSLAALTAPACDDDPVAEDGGGTGGLAGAGTVACDEIGSLCHDAEADPMGAECHELGHVGNGDACLERYDECISFCTEYLEGLGGTGGGGAAHGGAAAGGSGGA